MADINYTVNQDSPENIEGFEQYSQEDKNLISSFQINSTFNPEKNYSELHILSLSDELLESDYLYNRHKQLGNAQSAGQDGASVLTIDPIADSKYYGYEGAGIKLLYHFLDDLYTDDITTREFFIQDISPDRTEVVLNSLNITQEQVVSYTANIKSKLDTQSYFAGFRLNFKDNDLIIATNIDTIDSGTTKVVAVKLYEPLPDTYDLKSTLTVVEIISDSIAYEVDSEYTLETQQIPNLRPANFNIEIADESVVPTQYLNYNELFNYPVSNTNNEVYSLINEKGIDISVDYTDFKEFVHFSSAQERLMNFKYKIELIDEYSKQIVSGSGAVIGLTAITGSKDKYEQLITGIVSNFDHYERFLYYESGSSSWPKSNNTKPYTNQVGTTEANNWYSTQATTAALYDESNSNSLLYSIPAYLRDDANNENYLTFVYMIGQHFDNLWLYSKAVTDKYDADNRINKGISKDLVAEALKNFGVKLYTSNKSIEDLLTTFTGQAYQSGSEVVNYYITGSLTGSNTPIQPTSYDNYQKEIQKRIYHNLPFLLKTKGTERGLRALINCFGISSDILKIKQYGGVNTDTLPFLGDQQQYTSSLGKIRLDNVGTTVEGDTLSNSVSILKNNSKYTTDLHTIEVGLSPTDNIDSLIEKLNSDTCTKYIMYVTTTSTDTYTYIDCFTGKTTQQAYDTTRTFYAITDSVIYDQDSPTKYYLQSTNVPTVLSDIDYYLGDPNNLNLDNYNGLYTNAEIILKQLGTYDLQDYVRLIKFFDNTIFKMVKDFIPARSVATTGIIIKPNLLNKSKAKSVTVSVTQPEYTSSIDTAFVTGSDGGSFITTTPRNYQFTRYNNTCRQYTIKIIIPDPKETYTYIDCNTGLVEEYTYQQDKTFSAITDSVQIDNTLATLTSTSIEYLEDAIDQGMHQQQDTSYKEVLYTPQGQRSGLKNWQTDLPLYTGELGGTTLAVAGTEINRNNPFKQYNFEKQTNTLQLTTDIPFGVCGVRPGTLSNITQTSKAARNLQPDFAYLSANLMKYSIGGTPISKNYTFVNNYTTYNITATILTEPEQPVCSNSRNYITRFCDLSIKKIPSSSEARVNKILDLRKYFNTGSNTAVYWEYSGSEVRSGVTAAIPVNRRLYLPGALTPGGTTPNTTDNNLASAFTIKGSEGSVFTLKMYDYKSGLTPSADTTCFSQKMTVDIPTPYIQTNNNMDKLQVGYSGDGLDATATGTLLYTKNPVKILLTAKSPIGGWNPANNIFDSGQRTYSNSYVKLFVGPNYMNDSGFVAELTATSKDSSGRDAQVATKVVEVPAKFIGTTEFESGINIRITFRYDIGEQGYVPTNDPPNIYGWAEALN